MSDFSTGSRVLHSDYGQGIILEILGGQARVEFYGEKIDVSVDELQSCYTKVITTALEQDDRPTNFSERQKFHQIVEAINLGIVPPDQQLLLDLTIDGHRIEKKISGELKAADKNGLCKVVFGYYGAGKSHYLNLVRALALRAGWVVSFVEFDPKSADPARPHLVYRSIMSMLEFPSRDDGSVNSGILGLIKEVRTNSSTASLQKLRWFPMNPWFSSALEVLRAYPHDVEDNSYVGACSWLGGEKQLVRLITNLAREADINIRIPRMPAMKETSEIYVFNLVVVNELCRALGYRGLIIILDEAEHVRGYNVRRKERANNLFDLLARCAHVPLRNDRSPIRNDHDYDFRKYWREGPHFGLYVGLTEGEIFKDPKQSLRDACVFLHKESDRIVLQAPQPGDYEEWCLRYLDAFQRYYPEKCEVLSNENARKRIAKVLRSEFELLSGRRVVLRNWIKLAGLACSMQIVQQPQSVDELIKPLKKAAESFVQYF